ncbi:hypothetical protein Mal35_24560 [Gimesia maris]|uniref:hypothetical protein n=1 Tax=Gimesia maris TaxID=122 RepID=UPI00118A309E|nr:hypothetical protein [Gimesia maris]QDT79003.1 hypothetical protein Mal35_24560 [Gimesia maris]
MKQSFGSQDFKPMSVRVKRYLKIILTVLGCLLLMTVGIYFKYALHNPVTELETVTARIPLGISTAEADSLMSTPPDAISQTRGTLLNSTMLVTADNPLSAEQGDVQLYSLRTWHRGDRHATVVIDQSDKVAGHWTWSDHPSSSTSQFNLNQVAQSILKLWRALIG